MKSKKVPGQFKFEQASKELEVRLHKLARSTEPADRQLMESNVLRLYKALGKPEPHILWCDSPLEMFVIPFLIENYAESGAVSCDEVWKKAEQDYFRKLRCPLNFGALQHRLSNYFPLIGALRYRSEDAIKVFEILWEQSFVDGLKSYEVEWDFSNLANTYDVMNQRLREDFYTGMVGGAVRQLLNEGNFVDTDIDPAIWWTTVVPFYVAPNNDVSFIDLCHYQLLYSQKFCSGEPPVVRATRAWCDLIGSLWWIGCYEHTVFLCQRPARLCFDDHERLHSLDGPAVQFRDGYSQYFWHGMSVPEHIIEGPSTIERIESERNIELRRVLIERFGLQQYLFASGAEVVDVDKYGTLYRKEMGEFGEPILMVHVVNKTPEPDGSYHDYFLCVPPTMRTAREAVAWTFGLDADSYKPIVET